VSCVSGDRGSGLTEESESMPFGTRRRGWKRGEGGGGGMGHSQSSSRGVQFQ
jgi:hypothetical protein